VKNWINLAVDSTKAKTGLGCWAVDLSHTRELGATLALADEWRTKWRSIRPLPKSTKL